MSLGSGWSTVLMKLKRLASCRTCQPGFSDFGVMRKRLNIEDKIQSQQCLPEIKILKASLVMIN